MSAPHAQSRRVGRRIAAARQRVGLSVRELADKLGWPRDTLVNYELGRRAITIERLDQIAAALGASAATLLLEDEQLAALVGRLASDPALVAQVRFFLDTLDDDIPPGPPS
jgi:transcriptional regulator with XRE-family HTH domain